MKKMVFVLVLIAVALGVSACERNDYQHPMHRNGSK